MDSELACEKPCACEHCLFCCTAHLHTSWWSVCVSCERMPNSRSICCFNANVKSISIHYRFGSFFPSLQVLRSAGDCMRLRLCSVPLLTALARRTCSSRMTCWRCTWWCECDSLCIPMATRCTGKCNIAMESLSFSCLHYTKHVCPPWCMRMWPTTTCSIEKQRFKICSIALSRKRPR